MGRIKSIEADLIKLQMKPVEFVVVEIVYLDREGNRMEGEES